MVILICRSSIPFNRFENTAWKQSKLMNCLKHVTFKNMYISEMNYSWCLHGVSSIYKE